MKIAVLGLVALLALAGCGPDMTQASAHEEPAPVMPKIEGCSLQRNVVRIPNSLGGHSEEMVYVARCEPQKTVSASAHYSCGKSCTKTVTTVTTIKGTPDTEETK